MPSAAHLTVPLFHCSSGFRKQRNEASQGPLKISVSAQKVPRVREGDEGVTERNEREKYFPEEGVFFFTFYQKETEKIELVAKPSTIADFASSSSAAVPAGFRRFPPDAGHSDGIVW